MLLVLGIMYVGCGVLVGCDMIVECNNKQSVMCVVLCCSAARFIIAKNMWVLANLGMLVVCVHMASDVWEALCREQCVSVANIT